MIVKGSIKSALNKRGVSVNGRAKAILNPEVMYAKRDTRRFKQHMRCTKIRPGAMAATKTII